MTKLRILLHDTKTGDEAWYEEEYGNLDEADLYFLWLDGNYSCDCNRMLFLDRALNRDVDEELQCSNDRIILKEVWVNGIQKLWEDND